MPAEFSVLTLNLRNVLDRYDERRPLLTSEFAALTPDVAAFQESAFLADEVQDAMMAAAVPDRNYRRFDARSGRFPEFGNALLVGIGDCDSSDELRLSNGRCVVRTLVRFPGALKVWVATTHLHHRPDEGEERLHQVGDIIAWLRDATEAEGVILTGDFNALPSEPSVAAMKEAGYRSAFASVHGREPARTRPSGIQADEMDTEGEPGCVDYIWIAGSVEVQTCELAFDRPAPGDSTLFPSDHFGLLARVTVSEPGG